MPPRATSNTADPASPAWLPDFCSLPVLFAMMVVAEFVALIVTLAPTAEPRPFWPRLGSASLFVQWLALIHAVGLCKLRPRLLRLRPWIGELAAYAFMLAVTALGSSLVFSLDQGLALGLTLPASRHAHFVTRNVLIGAPIGAALLRYFYVLEQWRAGVRAEARARFEALQARIRPHFLFNSMNTIASLIRVRPGQAEAAVEDLSDLFRAALGAGDGLRSLGEELDLARRYLRIEQLRLGERLDVLWRVEALPRELRLPALLIQPLVENAVYHGVQALPEGGRIEVEGHQHGRTLEITVSNPCPPPGRRRSSGNGMALTNVQSRLVYHFGPHAALEVDDAGERFTCTLRLPAAPMEESGPRAPVGEARY